MTEERKLPGFQGVDLRGVGTVVLGAGAEQKVLVEAHEEVLPRVRTEVRAGVLIVGLRWWLGALLHLPQLRHVTVRVTVPELREVRLSGAGEMRSEGRLKLQGLDLRLGGAGRLRLELEAGRVQVGLSGAGTVELSGTAEELELRLSGAGTMRAEGLVCRRARVKASGAGDCRVHATDALQVELSGAGSVGYRGNPQVDSRISGAGKIAPLPPG